MIIKGVVIHGAELGRKLGFPTANLDATGINIANGGYFSKVEIDGNKYKALADKYMPNGTCGVLTFGIKGGREAATKFMDSMKLVNIATHVADAHSCLLHPASTTHRQLTEQQLIDAKVPGNLIRLSVGIENVQDIIEDIEQALAQI